ncbi:ABC transporter permease [Flindersiella endophytica]
MTDVSALRIRLSPRPRYLSIAVTAVQEAMAYRLTTLLTMVSNLVWVAVLYYVWRSVYGGRTQIEGFDWRAMQTYLVVAYSVNSLLSFQSLSQLTMAIRTGQVASELTRPVDFLATSMARASGRAVIEGLIGGAIALVVGVLLLDVRPPVSAWAATLFVVSAVLGFLIKFLIHYLVALLAFFTTSVVGLLWAEIALVNLLSGALIPLAFFPGWLQQVLAFLPFQGIVTTPVGIYLGRTGALAIVVQLVWVVVLVVLAKLLWRPSIRALDIQGG